MKNIPKSVFVGVAVLLVAGVVGANYYRKAATPAGTTVPAGTTSPTGAAGTSGTSGTSGTGAAAQEPVDVSSAVDASLAAAAGEMNSVNGSETDTQVINELDTQINAYGTIYDQSELN